jgi:acetate kinase
VGLDRVVPVRVLVINAGSSSLKHALIADGETILASAEERWDPGGKPGRHGAAFRSAIADGSEPPDAIGHRVVHGGSRFAGPARLNDDVRAAIESLVELAPLHNRAALEGIDAASDAFPDLPQVACFDTAFHHTIPAPAATYAIPREWTDRHGIRRFGFHGLNVEWCAGRAAELSGAEATRRLVVCHLGGGCSVTAVLEGRSVDTSMGFTPMEGVPMATRSGSIDPGLVLHLARAEGIEDVDRGLNHRSGLLGVSGRSADLREVIAGADQGDERCRLAFEVFVRGVAAAAAAMTTALGGLDCLVFTAGAGEGEPRLRAMVAARLQHLGMEVDPELNEAAVSDAEISPTAAGVWVLVVGAGEEVVIARQTADLLGADLRGG